MTTYFLDTSIIIDYLRNINEVVYQIEKIDGNMTSSFVCLAELYEGVSRSKNRKKVEEALLYFFSGLNQTFGLNLAISSKFGEIRAYLKQKGTLIDDLDIFIGSTCIVNDLTLITHNVKHFERIPGLKIYKIN